MAPRQSRKQATAERIRKRAGELFLQHGVEGVSVEDIAEAADISRASLFNYYRGKTAILRAMAEDLEPRLLQLLDHYLDKPLDSASRLRQLFAYSGRVLAQTGPLTRLIIVHGNSGEGFPSLQDGFTRLAAAGQEQGELREDMTAEELGDMMYLALLAGLLNWRQPGRDEEDMETALSRRAEVLVRLAGR